MSAKKQETQQESPTPETYQELATQVPILKGTKAKALPSEHGLLIAIVGGERFKKLPDQEKREAVSAVAGWARRRFADKNIAGVIVYNEAIAQQMKIAKEFGGVLGSILIHDGWSK